MNKMKIAVILFTYNRSIHTNEVLEALKRNTVMVEKLMIFQDGLKQNEDAEEWKKVNMLIRDIDWCETEVIVSEYNKGLAKSIISGINYAFREYDAVIVLEDDCVPTANFIDFMRQCFEKYESNKMVYSISGYSWPITLEKGEYDVYGCGRISSWGWGTWKDRWGIYERNYDLLQELKQKEDTSRNLALWGQDLEEALVSNLRGSADSWAVFWALNVISKEGICINPYESFINNIGMDGSGVHCGVTDRFEVKNIDEKKKTFCLPDKIEVSEDVRRVFASLYGSDTAISREDTGKEKILVYGAGNFFRENEKGINERYNIEAFVDKRKRGWLAGKRIIPINQIGQYSYDWILVMVWDIQECIDIVKELTDQRIDRSQIVLGHDLFGEYCRSLSRASVSREGMSIEVGPISLKVRSKDEFNNAYEVMAGQVYHYFINNGKKDVVIDVGMNIGAASLWFLNDGRTEKVYGYEPFMETYLMARENLQKHLENSDRIEVFQYGLSNENAMRVVRFNSNMTCGQSTMAENTEKAYKWYQMMGLTRREDDSEELVEVRDAAEVLLPIVQRHLDCNIILKLDCEGEEYGIVEELYRKNILSRISFIIMEWHYFGKDSILDYLEKAGFSYWCNDKLNEMGLVYAFKLEEERDVCE